MFNLNVNIYAVNIQLYLNVGYHILISIYKIYDIIIRERNYYINVFNTVNFNKGKFGRRL